MKRPSPLLAALPLVVVACAGAPPTPDERAAGAPTSTAATHSRVLAAIPPGTQRALREAARFEVLALVCERDPLPDDDVLRGYPVVKRVAVGEEVRRELLELVYRAVAEGGSFALCFEPHHAIVAGEGPDRVELVLCFECDQLRVYHPAADLHMPLVMGGRTDHGWSSITDAPRRRLDEVLGPVADRRLHGRTVQGWLEHLEARYGAADPRPAALADDDRAGVALIGTLLERASGDRHDDYAGLLGRMGPLGAPALPSLERLLGSGEPGRWSVALQLAQGLGPGAAPLVPVLVEAAGRDAEAWRARVGPRGEDDEPPPDDDEALELRLLAIRTLAAIGPDARGALPALEALRGSSDPYLAAEAARALDRVRPDGE